MSVRNGFNRGRFYWTEASWLKSAGKRSRHNRLGCPRVWLVKRVWVGAILLTTTLVAALTGCSSSGPAPGKSITVYAAASLKKTFTDIGEQFKTDNPGASIDFNFAGSSDLVTQLTQGATADVFASADTKNMDKATKAGLLVSNPVNLASDT